MLGGSKLRLPRAIRWSKRNFFITKKTHANNLSSIQAVSEVTERGLNFTSFCEEGYTNLTFSADRNGRLWEKKIEVTETREMEPPQCVEELEDDVFQPEDGEPGTQPGSLLSANLFAPSQLDCPLSHLQLFPLTHCCGPGLRPTSQEDKATQTLSPASPSQGVMLPCGVTEEPQRLFYGNAGYRLPFPASFPAGLPLGEQPPEGHWQHRAEVQIARKLQCIADQFHRLHMQQHQQNRRRVWWQILLFLHNLALNAEENRNGAGPR